MAKSISFADQMADRKAQEQDGFRPDGHDGRMAFWDKANKRWLRCYTVDAREMRNAGSGDFRPSAEEIAADAPAHPTANAMPPPPLKTSSDSPAAAPQSQRPILDPEDPIADQQQTGAMELAQARSVRAAPKVK